MRWSRANDCCCKQQQEFRIHWQIGEIQKGWLQPSLLYLVEMTGFEPATSTSRKWKIMEFIKYFMSIARKILPYFNVFNPKTVQLIYRKILKTTLA